MFERTLKQNFPFSQIKHTLYIHLFSIYLEDDNGSKYIFSVSINTIFRIIMAIFSKFFITIAYSCVYVWTVELFPTFIRYVYCLSRPFSTSAVTYRNLPYIIVSRTNDVDTTEFGTFRNDATEVENGLQNHFRLHSETSPALKWNRNANMSKVREALIL